VCIIATERMAETILKVKYCATSSSNPKRQVGIRDKLLEYHVRVPIFFFFFFFWKSSLYTAAQNVATDAVFNCYVCLGVYPSMEACSAPCGGGMFLDFKWRKFTGSSSKCDRSIVLLYLNKAQRTAPLAMIWVIVRQC
jgi:hypothetical protein